MSDVDQAVAEEIAAEVADGCSPEDVIEVARTGSVEPSVIGEEYDDAITEAIIAQLDRRGIEIG